MRISQKTGKINEGLCKVLWLSGFNSISSFQGVDNTNFNEMISEIENVLKSSSADDKKFIEDKMNVKVETDFALPFAYRLSLKVILQKLSNIDAADFQEYGSPAGPSSSQYRHVKRRIGEKLPHTKEEIDAYDFDHKV
jgi:hypothetical protein